MMHTRVSATLFLTASLGPLLAGGVLRTLRSGIPDMRSAQVNSSTTFARYDAIVPNASDAKPSETNLSKTSIVEDSINLSNDSAPNASRPVLRLTFETTLRSNKEFQQVAASAELLSISLRDLNSADGANGNFDSLGTARDGSILDFKRGSNFIHERFFDEVVCYEMDLPHGSAKQPAPNGNSELGPIASSPEDQFMEALGQVFRAPLELYTNTDLVGSLDDVAGKSCLLWSTNQSWSLFLRMGDNRDELTLQGITATTALPPNWLLQQAFVDVNISNVLGSPQLEFFLEVSPTFCVTSDGFLLASNVSRRTSLRILSGVDGNDTVLVPVQERMDWIFATVPPIDTPNELAFQSVHGVIDTHCLDLRSGTEGAKELQAGINDDSRVDRINEEAKGHWEAAPYPLWEGMIVEEIVPSLGTQIKPLRLQMKSSSPMSLRALTSLPKHFDARAYWSNCLSIGHVRNQGGCGSCWAVSSVAVLADRFCIAMSEITNSLSPGSKLLPRGNASDKSSLLQMGSLQALALSPEHLVKCDNADGGCRGGRLDDAWRFLQEKGAPSEACTPYSFCPRPTEPRCVFGEEELQDLAKSLRDSAAGLCGSTCVDGGQMHLFKASNAYAVAPLGDVQGIQRELLSRGPIQVSFFVFSDFQNYRRGVYFRTPAAFGPLGGHAVRLIGWGAVKSKDYAMDYWLAANSWSPEWGLGGFFQIRRGVNECGIETTPAAGLPLM